LNRIESEIINVNQEIYIFKDLISKLYQLNLETLQKAFVIVSDYVRMRSQPLGEIEKNISNETIQNTNDMCVEEIENSYESILNK
jgi:hypothetical protein